MDVGKAAAAAGCAVQSDTLHFQAAPAQGQCFVCGRLRFNKLSGERTRYHNVSRGNTHTHTHTVPSQVGFVVSICPSRERNEGIEDTSAAVFTLGDIGRQGALTMDLDLDPSALQGLGLSFCCRLTHLV